MFPNNRLLGNLRHYLSDNAESDSIPTLFWGASNVGLDYTQRGTTL